MSRLVICKWTTFAAAVLTLGILGPFGAQGTGKCDPKCIDKCGNDCKKLCYAEGFWLDVTGPKLCEGICGTECKVSFGSLKKFEDRKWTNCNAEDCYHPCNEALKTKKVMDTNGPLWNTCILNCIIRPDGVKPEDAECKFCDQKCMDKCAADCKNSCNTEGFWLDAGGQQVCLDICGTECEKTVGNITRIEDSKFKKCPTDSCYESCAAGISIKKDTGAPWNSCILSCIMRPEGVEVKDVNCADS